MLQRGNRRKKADKKPPTEEELRKEAQRKEEIRRKREAQKKEDDEIAKKKHEEQVAKELKAQELREAEEKDKLKKEKERQEQIKRNRENGLTQHDRSKKNNRTAKGQRKVIIYPAVLQNLESEIGNALPHPEDRTRKRTITRTVPPPSCPHHSQEDSSYIPSSSSAEPVIMTTFAGGEGSAQPSRIGTLVGDKEAALLLKKFDPTAQKMYEEMANKYGPEFAKEQMETDFAAHPPQAESDGSITSSSSSSSSSASPRVPSSPRKLPPQPSPAIVEMVPRGKSSLLPPGVHLERSSRV